MPTLTMAQMEMYAAAAGLPEPKKWAAIGMAESGGRTDVVNIIGCVGIWQINQPVHVKAHPHWTVKWLQDPANNARAAKVIFDAQGWEAWEAYTGPDGRGSDGPWRRHYNGPEAGGGATQADLPDWLDGALGGPLGGGASGMLESAQELGRIAQAIAKAGNWMAKPENWLRVGYVAGGGVLVAVGLSAVIRGQAIRKVAPVLGGAVGGKVKSAAKAVGKKRNSDSDE